MLVVASAEDIVQWLVHYIVPFVLMITPIVFFHELGHFLMARLFGVAVETFSIGFGPAIFSWNDRKGTRWKVSWIPLGGFVKFAGDANAASIPDTEQLEHLTGAEREAAFAFKPLYQRALVVLAGPVANFVLAIVIFAAFLLAFGGVVVAPVVGKVLPGSPADHAGFHGGDTIVSIDGQAIDSFDQIPQAIFDQAGKSVTVVVKRSGRELVLHPTPALSREMGQQVAKLGIQGPDVGQWKVVRYGPLSALSAAGHETWSIVTTTLQYLGRVIIGSDSAAQLNGPIGIVKISAAVAAVSYLNLVRLAAFLSVSVGLINLFPIPVLDGGHLLYYGLEAVLGRPLGARAQDLGFRLGFAVILGLLLLATFNDLRLNPF